MTLEMMINNLCSVSNLLDAKAVIEFIPPKADLCFELYSAISRSLLHVGLSRLLSLFSLK